MTGVRGGVTKRGPKVHLDYKQSAGYCWLLHLRIDRSRALTLVKTVRRAFRDRDPLTHRGEKSGQCWTLVDESGQCWTREGFPHSPLQRSPSLSLSIQQIKIEIWLFSICFILHFSCQWITRTRKIFKGGIKCYLLGLRITGRCCIWMKCRQVRPQMQNDGSSALIFTLKGILSGWDFWQILYAYRQEDCWRKCSKVEKFGWRWS